MTVIHTDPLYSTFVQYKFDKSRNGIFQRKCILYETGLHKDIFLIDTQLRCILSLSNTTTNTKMDTHSYKPTHKCSDTL